MSTDPKPPATGETQPVTVLAHINTVADRLGLTPYQVRRLIADGRLASERIGAKTFIPMASLREYIESLGKSA